MPRTLYFALALLVGFLPILQGCNKAFVVDNVNYAQHVESVLQPDTSGFVHDVRYAIHFSILPFQFQEFSDSSSVLVQEVRLIRDREGFYYITADQFKHVYVMSPERSSLRLISKIHISEIGVENPSFNWRSPNVELVLSNEANAIPLSTKGIIKQEKAS